MATKRHFVRYLEPREQLTVSSSPTFVMTTSFNAGVVTTRNAGHKTKKAALEWIAKINIAAGKTIAEYAGSLVPTPYDC